MDLKSFTELVNQEVSNEMGNGYKVRLNNVRKNNGIVLTGLTIIQDKCNVSPTIYLNHYYEDYVNGGMTIPNVSRDVIDAYHRNKVKATVDMKFFLDFERVRPRVVYKLINAEKNKELLEDIPYIEYMDLAIVFQCIIFYGELGTVSILIHKSHLKLWDLTVGQIFQIASVNTPKLMPHEIESMAEVICDIKKEENPEDFDYDACMEELSDSVPMYVLSNKNRVEGAVCVVYPNVLQDFAETINSSFYIIPSSVHEVLLIPAMNVYGGEEIKAMIQKINDTQIKAEEILSYSLYFYDKDEGKTVML